ncbi:hypothetical protein, partial [Pandoraea apista]|uniref:hypothetical protein n=1 Tax=Pandoraea apista TaxID=93218 RepID=UPI001C8C97D5
MSFVHTARALPAIGRPGARNAVALRTNMAPLALATLLSFTANSAFAQSVPAKVAAAEVRCLSTMMSDFFMPRDSV